MLIMVTIIISRMMMMMMVMKVLICKLTWYDVWWDKEGNPGDDNKKAGRQIVGDDV